MKSGASAGKMKPGALKHIAEELAKETGHRISPSHVARELRARGYDISYR